MCIQNRIKYPLSHGGLTGALAGFRGSRRAYLSALMFDNFEELDTAYTLLTGFCPKHRVRFETSALHLFTKSKISSCQVCDWENGFRRTESWTEERVERLLCSVKSTWSLVRENPKQNRILIMKDRLTLVCEVKDREGLQCVGPHRKPTVQSLRNIQSLATRPDHVMCQGSVCDQKKRGKSCRVGQQSMEKRLFDRASAWKILPNGASKISDDWVAEHKPCGVQVICGGGTLARNEPNCPLCTSFRSTIRLHRPHVDAPRILQAITEGRVEWASASNVPSRIHRGVPLPVRCVVCDTSYSPQLHELNYAFHGCPTCKKIASESNATILFSEIDSLTTTKLGNFQRRIRGALDARVHIEKRGGRLAPDAVYQNSSTRIHFFCPYGHEAAVSLDKLRGGSWCQQCHDLHKSLPEVITRTIVEIIIEEPMKKVRPDWLRSSKTNERLEFDGLNESGSIALEVQSKYHLKPEQQGRDEDKAKIAEQRNIALILVWDLNPGWAPDRMFDHVEEAIREAGLEVPAYDRSLLDLAKIYRAHEMRHTLLKKIEDRGGELLSDFFGIDSHVSIWCGHSEHSEWTTKPASIIYQDTWCPSCAAERLALQKLADSEAEFERWLREHSSVRVNLTDGQYQNATVKHRFFCDSCHWPNELSFLQIKSRQKDPQFEGRWCSFCRQVISSQLKLAADQAFFVGLVKRAERLCKVLGFVIVANPSRRACGRFELQCQEDAFHRLKRTIYQLERLEEKVSTSPSYVACDQCRGDHRKKKQDAQKLAADLGGEFLDAEFSSVKTLHRWRFDGVEITRSYDGLNRIRRNRIKQGLAVPFVYQPGQNKPWTWKQADAMGRLLGLRLKPGQTISGIHRQYEWEGSEKPLTLNSIEMRARKKFGKDAVKRIRQRLSHPA